jgi:hypothetical protein
VCACCVDVHGFWRQLPVWARGYQSTKRAEPELIKEYSEEEDEDDDEGQGEGEDGDSAEQVTFVALPFFSMFRGRGVQVILANMA